MPPTIWRYSASDAGQKGIQKLSGVFLFCYAIQTALALMLALDEVFFRFYLLAPWFTSFAVIFAANGLVCTILFASFFGSALRKRAALICLAIYSGIVLPFALFDISVIRSRNHIVSEHPSGIISFEEAFEKNIGSS